MNFQINITVDSKLSYTPCYALVPIYLVECLIGTRKKTKRILNGYFKFEYLYIKVKNMSKEIRQMIDKVRNFKQFVNESYKYSYYDNPKESETFNPEYYLLTKLDGEGYDGDYSEFRNSGDYEPYIDYIQNTIDEIKLLKFPLRIYRGLNEKEIDLLKLHQHESENISWTHNLNVAKNFANGGVILTGVVNYNNVDIQATINRNVLHSMLYEDEIVLKDNKLIKDLKKLK